MVWIELHSSCRSRTIEYQSLVGLVKDGVEPVSLYFCILKNEFSWKGINMLTKKALYHSIYYVRDFTKILHDQIENVLRSVEYALKQMRKVRDLDDSQQKQLFTDINTLKDKTLIFYREISNLNSIAKQEAETQAKIDPDKVQFDQKNISSINSVLNTFFNMMLGIKPRAKLYHITGIYDEKDAHSIMRRLNNLKKMFMSYTTDKEDRALLNAIKSDVLRSASVVERLVCLADRLDKNSMLKEADLIDRLIPFVAEASFRLQI